MEMDGESLKSRKRTMPLAMFTTFAVSDAEVEREPAFRVAVPSLRVAPVTETDVDRAPE